MLARTAFKKSIIVLKYLTIYDVDKYNAMATANMNFQRIKITTCKVETKQH